LVAVPTATEAVKLLGLLRAHQADQLLAFELMSDRAYSYGAEHAGFSASPFATDHPWYVLLEVAEGGHADTLQDFLVDQVADGRVLDAIVAKSIAEARQLWQVRHGISEGQKTEGASIKHDVSVPIGRINEFMLAAERAVLQVIPDARIVAFGHVGDGNLHYNITQPAGADTETFRSLGAVASKAVYELVAELGGSFSAEHGVGVLKKSLLEMYRSGIEVDMMRTLKKALDPHNTLNPGKVI
jgi:FAD/FMN-containing dehydrogenase